MNENSSTHSTTSTAHHGLTAEAISRRAYELWEQEGRPENRDLHHWLRAEKELLAEQAKKSGQSTNSTAPRNVDLPQNQAQSQNQATRSAPPSSRSTAGKQSAPRSTQPGMRTEPMRPPSRS